MDTKIKRPPIIERIEKDWRIQIKRVSYHEYPYDHFLFVGLPDGRTFIYRDESDNFLICELQNDWTGDFVAKAFSEIDEVVKTRLFRLPD